jgi:hypothetical protein
MPKEVEGQGVVFLAGAREAGSQKVSGSKSKVARARKEY